MVYVGCLVVAIATSSFLHIAVFNKSARHMILSVTATMLAVWLL